MDIFPAKCFPFRYHKENALMHYFGGLGSIRNIDVADSYVQERKLLPQHVPFESEWYCATRPALPVGNCPAKGINERQRIFERVLLYNKYAKVPYPFEDRVFHKTELQSHKVEAFCNKLKVMKANLKKPRNTTMQTQFENVLKGLEALNCTQAENPEFEGIDVPPWLGELVKQYEKVKDIPGVLRYNSRYTGGCITKVGTKTTNGTQMLISPADHNFNSLAFLELSTTPEVNVAKKSTIELCYEIYQLRSAQCRNQDYCVARGENVCEVFTNQETSDGFSYSLNSIGKEYFPDEHLTSVDLSVYIPSECLVASNQGNIYLWSPGMSKTPVQKNMETRFLSHESWRQALFGSHPRHVIIADSTAVQITDTRMRSSTCVDLFALPSKLFHSKERLCLVEKHPSSHHAYLIASDTTLLLMDDRFPGCPMLEWKHMLRKPPQVASSVVMDTDSILVAMGSLYPADVFAFQYRYGHSGLPQSLGSPWRFSHFGDFTELPGLCNPLHKFASDMRFDVSLAGISLIDTPSGFSLVQMDSLGELYFQEFEKSIESREVRFSSGPSAREETLDKFTVERAKKWTEELHDYINSCKKSMKEVNVTDIFSEISLNCPGHVSCSLCMLDTCDLQMTDSTQALCYSCLHLISEARVIADAKMNNIVQSADVMESYRTEDDGKAEEETCSLGEILVLQWNDDSDEDMEEYEEKFRELLLKRNEVVKERRRSMKKIPSKTLQREVSTLVEGHISPPLSPMDEADLVPDDKELQDLITKYTGVTEFNTDRPLQADGASQSVTAEDVEQNPSEMSNQERDTLSKRADTTETLSDCEEKRTNFTNEQESDNSKTFVSQVERDYPFMKNSPRKRKINSQMSDRMSNLSSMSLLSDGFLSTPQRLLSLHSPAKNKIHGGETSEKDTQDGREVQTQDMSGSFILPIVPLTSRTRPSSASSVCSRRSVKSHASVQSEGFRSTPSRMHILHSPAKLSRVLPPEPSSARSSLSDLFDSSIKAFDLLRRPMTESPGSHPTNSQTDNQGRKKVKKQLLSGF